MVAACDMLAVMTALARPMKMTPEEFVAWEREQPERYEFLDGDLDFVQRLARGQFIDSD